MTTAAQKRRTASDALKGTATPAEETLPEVPATEDTKPEETPADAVADADKAAEVDGAVPASAIAEDEDEDEDEDDTVAVTVVIAQFNYFDEDGSHCSAAKGVTVHVDRAAAERGVKLGAVKVQD